jgi:hypothetical protein
MSIDTVSVYGWYGGSDERLTQVSTYGWYDPGIVLVGTPLDFFQFELYIRQVFAFEVER